MSTTFGLGGVAAERFDDVRALLLSAGLPADDLAAARAPDFIVARDGDRIVGAVALERYGGVALLRSLAVEAAHRGHGLGSELVAAAERRARQQGIAQVVLLTQTAEGFFAQHGYRKAERASAPAALQASPQFALLCPSSAAFMQKDLT